MAILKRISSQIKLVAEQQVRPVARYVKRNFTFV